MVQIARNIVMMAVLLTGTAINIYFDLINPYTACALALAAAYISGRFVGRLFVRRAHGKMTQLYGEDWAK